MIRAWRRGSGLIMKTQKTEPVRPVYYFYGDEDYLIDRAVDGIRSRALQGGFESMNYHTYDAKTLDAAEVVTVARTMPAFSGMRLVVVRGAESLKVAQVKVFEEYVRSPSPSTCIVFVARGAKVDRKSEFFRYLKAKGCVKAYRLMEEDEVCRWIVNHVRGEGKKISEAAARKLVAVTGCAIGDVKGELDKIVLFTGDREEISEDDVERCALGIRDETSFDLAEAVGKRDVAGALCILSMLEGEEPSKVLGAVAWHFRQLVKVKALMEKGAQPYRISQLLRMSEKNVRRYMATSRSFSDSELMEVLAGLSKADVDIKSGRMPGGLVLTRLVMECCSGRALRQA